VAGDREVESGQISVRRRTGEDLGNMTVAAFSDLLNKEIEKMGRTG
jgi:threonyl-tRNA synthetase